MTSAIEIALIAGLIILMIVRRFGGQPLTTRRLLALPAVLTVVGGYQYVSELHGKHLHTIDVGLLVVEVLLALGLGAVRALTILVYERGGHLWYRYRPATLAVWAASIAIRFGVVAGAHAIGATQFGTGLIVLMLGVSLLGEAAVTGPRALRSGIPFAPDKRTARAAAGIGPRR